MVVWILLLESFQLLKCPFSTFWLHVAELLSVDYFLVALGSDCALELLPSSMCRVPEFPVILVVLEEFYFSVKTCWLGRFRNKLGWAFNPLDVLFVPAIKNFSELDWKGLVFHEIRVNFKLASDGSCISPWLLTG
jgi:hypothetical protein